MTVWHRRVTADDWRDLARRQLADPSWSIGTKRLTDADVADVAAMYAGRDVAGARLAIVANQSWGTAQSAEADFDRLGVHTMTFNHLDTACAWLGIDSREVFPVIAAMRAEIDAAGK